jgi:mannose-6-phosphate isomerase-like protein (cupin superfamily)
MAKTKARPKTKTKAKAAARAKTSARRALPRRSAVKAKPKRKATTRPKQTFVVSHLNEKDFQEGLRSYAKYRDLGISKATNGLAQAHVIRLIGPCDPKVVSKRHYHDVDFQMIYVLKGWMKGEYDGQLVTVREGSCWLQPPRIKHTVLDYSDDCELLEIILPAEFDTVEL